MTEFGNQVTEFYKVTLIDRQLTHFLEALFLGQCKKVSSSLQNYPELLE